MTCNRKENTFQRQSLMLLFGFGSDKLSAFRFWYKTHFDINSNIFKKMHHRIKVQIVCEDCKITKIMSEYESVVHRYEHTKESF